MTFEPHEVDRGLHKVGVGAFQRLIHGIGFTLDGDRRLAMQLGLSAKFLLRGRKEMAPIEKDHPRLPNTSQCKVLLYMPPVVWAGVKMVPTEMSTAHSYSTSIHIIGLFAPLGHNTQRGRQTERAI